MTCTQEHLLDDKKWHVVVPTNEVFGIKKSDPLPKILWIGKSAVEGPFHRTTQFSADEYEAVEFHRYHGSWNPDGFDRTFDGEVLDNARRIPVSVWITELGFGITAIDKPPNSRFDEVQLRLPTQQQLTFPQAG